MALKYLLLTIATLMCFEQAFSMDSTSDTDERGRVASHNVSQRSPIADEATSYVEGNVKSNRIPELLHRNLQEVFGQGDSALRRAAIDELYTEDCEVYVPVGMFVGREALDKFAGELRATHPLFVYTPHGEPQPLHDAGRLAWGSGLRGEAPAYTGLDVIIVRDDKIWKLYVFLDS